MVFESDLKIIRKAGFTVIMPLWEVVAPEIMAHIAMLICDAPETHNLETVEWAIDILEWPKREWELKTWLKQYK